MVDIVVGRIIQHPVRHNDSVHVDESRFPLHVTHHLQPRRATMKTRLHQPSCERVDTVHLDDTIHVPPDYQIGELDPCTLTPKPSSSCCSRHGTSTTETSTMKTVGVHRRGPIRCAPVPVHSAVEASCAAVT